MEACGRLKGGKLARDKLRTQLQKIAAKRTGGARTDEILGHENGGPEDLPHSIIVTPEGPEGEAPAPPAGGPEGKTSELSRSARATNIRKHAAARSRKATVSPKGKRR